MILDQVGAADWIGDPRESRFTLQNDLRIPCETAAALIRMAQAIIERRYRNGFCASENSGDRLGCRTQNIDLRIVERFVPMRSACMDRGPRCFAGAAKTLHGLGPDQTEGSQFCNLDEEFRTHRK